MVIKQKAKKERATLEQLEKESAEEIKSARAVQQKTYKEILAVKNNSAFYFSIVFGTQQERDIFCKRHGIILKDNEYILSEDYNISMERK